MAGYNRTFIGIMSELVQANRKLAPAGKTSQTVATFSGDNPSCYGDVRPANGVSRACGVFPGYHILKILPGFFFASIKSPSCVRYQLFSPVSRECSGDQSMGTSYYVQSLSTDHRKNIQRLPASFWGQIPHI